MLEISNIDVFYGRVQALRGVTLSVDAGEIVALIGSNGAGKTTTLRTISGLMHPTGGKIVFDGRELQQTKAHMIVKTGICQSPEGRRLFPRMTVFDNLMMGTYARKDLSGVQADIVNVYDLFPRLKERTKQLAGTLSGGEQQMLAIGRAVSRPRADPRGDHLPRLHGHQFTGPADPPGRAEREQGARDRAPRVRSGDRLDRPDRDRQGTPLVA